MLPDRTSFFRWLKNTKKNKQVKEQRIRGRVEMWMITYFSFQHKNWFQEDVRKYITSMCSIIDLLTPLKVSSHWSLNRCLFSVLYNKTLPYQLVTPFWTCWGSTGDWELIGINRPQEWLPLPSQITNNSTQPHSSYHNICISALCLWRTKSLKSIRVLKSRTCSLPSFFLWLNTEAVQQTKWGKKSNVSLLLITY